MLGQLIQQLKGGQPLDRFQVFEAVNQLVREEVAVDSKAAFLGALHQKGETVEEIAAFAEGLRERSIPPVLDPVTRAGELVDVCGTGGDRLHTFNISTAVALVVAAAGVRVAKHGNRAITSQAGSADVLEALGVRTDLTPVEAGVWLREHDFAFFFAPNFHPAFKHIGPARRLCAERGQRTVFNFLGPLLNPARPTAQLVGVPHPDLCEPIGRVLQSLGIRRGIVVSSRVVEGCLDELSLGGENTVCEFGPDQPLTVSRLNLEAFPGQPSSLADLAGGDRHANGRTIQRLLRGEDRGPKRDILLLNAGAALAMAGRTRTWREGWDLAATVIDSGKAQAKLEELIRG